MQVRRTTGPEDDLIAQLYVQAERTAARLVGRDLAEDIASETIIRALSRWQQVEQYPHAWVTRVAANLAIDHLRKRRPRLDRAEDSSPSVESNALSRVTIANDLRRLSRRQRDVVVLHYLLEFTDAEVAQTLQMSVPTVKTHLSRALASLRRRNTLDWEDTDASADPA